MIKVIGLNIKVLKKSLSPALIRECASSCVQKMIHCMCGYIRNRGVSRRLPMI